MANNINDIIEIAAWNAKLNAIRYNLYRSGNLSNRNARLKELEILSIIPDNYIWDVTDRDSREEAINDINEYYNNN